MSIRPCEQEAANYIHMMLDKDDPGMLRVWRFNDAPKWLQEVSANGGDEDWLMLMPPNYSYGMPEWANAEWMHTTFGNSIDEYDLPNGWKVVIGSHA